MDFKELAHAPSTWALGFAIAAILGVWWARLTPMTTNISLALAALAIASAVYFQPWVQTQNWPVRIIWALGAGCLAALLAYYTLWVDLSKATVEPVVFVSTAAQASDAKVDGISWTDKFTELRMAIRNPTKWDYLNLDLTIAPDTPVVAAELVSPLANASLWRAGPPIFTMELVKNGQRIKIDLVPLASDFGYRVRVPSLPADSHIELRMAIANMAEFSTQPPSPPPADFGVLQRDYVLRMKTDDGKSIWYGYADRPTSVFSNAVPKKVHIAGAFEVAGEKKKVSMNVDAVDPMVAVITAQPK